jgi:hypothetical protein
MPFLIIIDKPNGQWEIIDHTFPNFPTNNPVQYIATKIIDNDPKAEEVGTVNIEHAVTGAKGTGEVVKI